jgi:hypothetical protein
MKRSGQSCGILAAVGLALLACQCGADGAVTPGAAEASAPSAMLPDDAGGVSSGSDASSNTGLDSEGDAAVPDSSNAGDSSNASDGSVGTRSDAASLFDVQAPADAPWDAATVGPGDGSGVADARTSDGSRPAPARCDPGDAGDSDAAIVRPPFAPPPLGCGNETPGRRPAAAQQLARRPTCPAPPISETAIAPNCPLANPNDNMPDDDALQACLDGGGTVALAAGTPGFILAKGLKITQDGTTLRAADPAHLARFVADATLQNTMILGLHVANVVVRFLELDGNRPARTAFLPMCHGYRLFASGLVVDFARNFAILDNHITRTLCGAAVEVDGVDFEIARNFIEWSGHGTEARDAAESWADGITLHTCNNGQVHDNLVVDATDVGIVSGGGACDIEHNEVTNERQHTFGSITLHDFTLKGVDHTGAVVAYNTVNGRNGMVAFGFSLGIHPWHSAAMWASSPAFNTGGTVACNNVSGGVVNIEVDGVKGITVQDNTIGPTGSATPRCNGAATGYTSYSAHVLGSTLQPGWLDREYDGCIP